MRASIALFALASAACAPPALSMNVTVVAPPAVVVGQPVPPSSVAAVVEPDAATPPAPSVAKSSPGIVIHGSALQRLGDDELSKRAMETVRGLRGLASIGRRDEAAARDGIRLTYARTPADVRAYVLWQYTFVRMKVLDEEHELTRRLDGSVEGSDAPFDAPGNEDDVDGAADALEALARRLVADP